MSKPDSQYRLEEDGSFVIENYNSTRAFSSFFPGIAGLFGIPLWAFYVNRGQCISSFGIRSKEEPIFEFLPANKAYQLTSTQGFRTFIKIKGKKNGCYYEPFSSSQKYHYRGIKNRMIIRPYELAIEEDNPDIGLRTRVEYFPVPNSPYAAMVRELVVENTSKKALDIEVIDGASVILPTGVNNWFLKEMSRTIEAWMTVSDFEKGFPLFKLSTDPRDTAQVTFVKGANFYAGFEGSKPISSTKIIVDPLSVFGQVTDLSFPEKFLNDDFVYPSAQVACNKTPCAFSHLRMKLKAKEKKKFTSIIGHVFDCAHIEKYKLRDINEKFVQKKRQENRELIDTIMDRALTVSSSRLFDMYARQTYLDNVLRGGLPYSVSVNDHKRSTYVFSRKHGDPERDYNYFLLSPSYFSEGEGNYRDVNQNRRCDCFFNPLVAEKNVVDFISLLQLDGYNPLIFKGEKFILSKKDFENSGIAKLFHPKDASKIEHILGKPYSVGEILHYIEDNKIYLACDVKDLVKHLLCFAASVQEAAHGEGFWSDHWTYNLDLLENFCSVYPDRAKWLFFDKDDFTYFDTHVFVRPRCQRYNIQHGEVRQYHSLVVDDAKLSIINKRDSQKHCVRANNGDCEILKVNLVSKLICLMVNKLATLDPCGVGIEMEAEKPNWYDALNGLPGLLGSSLSETFELKRLMLFVKDTIIRLSISPKTDIVLFAELYEFFSLIFGLLREDLGELDFWNKANDGKEEYRLKVRRGISGQQKKVCVYELLDFIDLALAKVDKGIDQGLDQKGCYTTYFSYRVTKHETSTDASGKRLVQALSFEQHRLPYFLEGFVHALRTQAKESKAIYQALRKSPLFDKKLSMYKVNASLEDESFEIGRCKAFTPGWLENESIWLHMEYKFLLELLKNRLFDEFYKEFFKILIPFQKPATYGRSVLENSSFIVSSAHPDKSLHGGGFVARLSGSTAEFLHIWLLMNAGPKPFFLNKDLNLSLTFKPALSSRFFTAKRTKLSFLKESGERFVVDLPARSYSFLFLGSALVTYINPKKKNTYGPRGVRPTEATLFDKGKIVAHFRGDIIPMPYSSLVREGKVDRIEITLG